MSAKAEVIISIRLEPNADDGHGIADDAEVIYDEIFYQSGRTVDDVMSDVEDALQQAKFACEQRGAA